MTERLDPEIPTDYLSAGEAASVLGVTNTRVRELRMEGRLPCGRLRGSGARFYRLAAVEELRDELEPRREHWGPKDK